MENKKNKKQKKIYIQPVTEVIEFENVDLITSSGFDGNQEDPGDKDGM